MTKGTRSPEVIVNASVRKVLGTEDILYFLKKHQKGEWGNISKIEEKINDAALQHGYMVVSSFVLGAETLIIKTNGERTKTSINLATN
ncbi:hypothetical protein GCM10011351_20780 [Paraliobacillus quinghaiensis]|uniref:Uncharacterized protein n=1 Tax=Paraliobacillus quinghaiensis TaxID=470815 RepID=A0A917WUW9_9BACI|nr:hypothetical protein [Paraliobacillus quinghaiensis]GGM34620.1 hypothetical protein GCM10011351_20780 [Paraliobacillus quinghaiensis]